MSDPTVAISPMASGRFESSARALLDTLLAKRNSGGDEEEGEGVSPPSPVRRSLSSKTGGAAPNSTIFFLGFCFCFVLPWLHWIRMVRWRRRVRELWRLWREGDFREEANWVLRGFRAGDIGEIRWGGAGGGGHFLGF